MKKLLFLILTSLIALAAAPGSKGSDELPQVPGEKREKAYLKEMKQLPLLEAAYKPGRPPIPTVLKSEKDAATVLAPENIAELVKRVDFNKETVLVFAWKGSGGDKLSYAVSSGAPGSVVITYKGGLTEDLRSHEAFYVIPNKTRWSNGITWDEAKALILADKVGSVFQTHGCEVMLSLKNGNRVNTIEPGIDDIIRFIRDNKKDIPIATE